WSAPHPFASDPENPSAGAAPCNRRGRTVYKQVFGYDPNNLRDKDITSDTPTEGGHAKMPANGTTKNTGTKATPSATGTGRAGPADRKPDDATTYVRQTAERSVDVPVGAVLTVADRVNGIVEPWTSRTTA